MKIILISLFLLSSLYADISFRDDKKKHFGISYICGALGEVLVHSSELSAVENILYATALGLIPGVVKELSDDEFDKYDFAYDTLGSLSGAISAYYFTNWLIEPQGDSIKVSYNIKF